MLSPAALSLLAVTFASGQGRNLAMGIWGALAGLGGTLGVVIGGILIDSIRWRWVFFVNVPIGVAVVFASTLLITESRVEGLATRSFDVPGALLGTGGLLSLVFAVVRSQVVGLGIARGGRLPRRRRNPPGRIHGGRAAGVVAAGAAAAVPAPILRISTIALALNGAAFLAMFFLTATFLQQVRGLSALSTGLELLPMGVAAIGGRDLAPTRTRRRAGHGGIGRVAVSLSRRWQIESSSC